MATTLYVGHIPYSWTADNLARLCETFGTVNFARVILDPQTARSKGYGFVEMADDQDAQEAIRRLDGRPVNNHAIAVRVANPPQRQQRPTRPGPGMSRYEDRHGGV